MTSWTGTVFIRSNHSHLSLSFPAFVLTEIVVDALHTQFPTPRARFAATILAVEELLMSSRKIVDILEEVIAFRVGAKQRVECRAFAILVSGCFINNLMTKFALHFMQCNVVLTG